MNFIQKLFKLIGINLKDTTEIIIIPEEIPFEYSYNNGRILITGAIEGSTVATIWNNEIFDVQKISFRGSATLKAPKNEDIFLRIRKFPFKPWEDEFNTTEKFKKKGKQIEDTVITRTNK